MEETGIRVDTAVLAELSTRLAARIDDIAQEIYANWRGIRSISIRRSNWARFCLKRWLCPRR